MAPGIGIEPTCTCACAAASRGEDAPLRLPVARYYRDKLLTFLPMWDKQLTVPYIGIRRIRVEGLLRRPGCCRVRLRWAGAGIPSDPAGRSAVPLEVRGSLTASVADEPSMVMTDFIGTPRHRGWFRPNCASSSSAHRMTSHRNRRAALPSNDLGRLHRVLMAQVTLRQRWTPSDAEQMGAGGPPTAGQLRGAGRYW